MLVEHFERRRFLVYFAERVHSSDALTTSIFRALRASEYFLFVDFCRERIGRRPDSFRGSLFVSQEIAIATFLNLSGVGFVEHGINREGIRQYHIYNERTFRGWPQIRDRLDGLTATWDPTFANELALQLGPPTLGIGLKGHRKNVRSDWYHLNIVNRSGARHALAVHAYVRKITNLGTGAETICPTNEIVWAGQGNDITANVLARSSKELDAFYVIDGEQLIHFHQRALASTHPRHYVPSLKPGRYDVEYTVIASNFETTARIFRIEFDGTRKSVKFGSVDVPLDAEA